MRRFAIVFLLGITGLARAAALPPYVKLPSGAQVVAETLIDETYGQANMPVAEDMSINIRTGRHITFEIRLPGVDDSTHEGIWAPFRTALTSGGWTVARYYDVNPPSVTLRYQKGGADWWLILTMFADDDIRCDLVEVRPF